MSVVREWERRVAMRRSAIHRVINQMKQTKSKIRKHKLRSSLHDMMYYGIMDKHKKHWHKINGNWYLDIIKSSKKLR